MLKRLKKQTRSIAANQVALAATCVVGGVVFASAWLIPSLFAMTWLGLATLLVLINDKSAKQVFAIGWVFGLAVIMSGFWWAAEPIGYSMGCSALVAYAIFIGFAVFESAKFAVFASLSRWLIGSGKSLILVYPFVWVALEYCWPQVLPWKLGYSQIDWLPMIQVAEYGGAFAVSFLVVAVAIIISQLFLAMRDSVVGDSFPSQMGSANAIPCVVLLLLVVGGVALGTNKLNIFANADPTSESIRVGLVQVDPTYSDNRETLVALTREIESEVDLVCWPESSIGSYDSELRNFRNEDNLFAYSRRPNLGLRPLANPKTILLASGKSFDRSSPEEGPYHVTAFLIDSDENIIGRYHKRCLIPVGEKVPFENYLPFLREWANLDDITEPGSEPTVLKMGDNTKLGAMICYEDVLPGSARELSLSGANLLVCLINGTAFDQSIALRQHQQLAVFRAIENRRFLVRCASTGVTSIIAPSGAIVSQLEPKTQGTLIADVGLLNQQTCYTLHGDLFAVSCLYLVGALIVVRLVRNRLMLRDNGLNKVTVGKPNAESFIAEELLEEGPVKAGPVEEETFDLSHCRACQFAEWPGTNELILPNESLKS